MIQYLPYRFFLLLGLGLLLLTSELHAQNQVHLIVLDKQSKPVEDALVLVQTIGNNKKETSLLTNAFGKASWFYSGPFMLCVHRVGFDSFIDTVYQASVQTIHLKSNKTVLSDLVVTGQFEETTTDKSVQKIRVIDQRRINAQGAVNLKDLLSNELNIRINQDAVLGSQMSMMGIGGQNLKLLIDGVPVIGRMDGNIDLSQINLSNIERVEVIEGPMSVIYGTDALGGVINLITKRPQKTSYQAGLNAYYESVGTYNTDARFGIHKGNWQGSVSGGRNFFDGYSPIEGPYLRWKQWKPREQYFADAQVRYRFKNQSHRLSGQWFDESILSRTEAVVSPVSATGTDFYFVTNRMNLGLYSDFLLPNKATLNLINSYSYYSRAKIAYIKNLTDGSSELSSNSEDQDTSYFNLFLMRATYNTHRKSKFNLQTGYDINIETGGGDRMAGQRQLIGDYALFFVGEYKPLARLIIHPGLRAIYNTRYGAPFIPSLNAKYELNSSWTLRGSYARGFRAPSLKELSLFFVDMSHNIKGNENLKAEHSDNFSATLTGIHTFSALHVKVDFSTFYNRMFNLISLAMVDAGSQLYSYVNIDQYSTKGAYVNTECQWRKVSVSGGYSYTGRFNQLSTSTSAAAYSYASEYRVNAAYKFIKSGADLNVFCKFNGALPAYALDNNNTLYQTKIQSYTMLDMSASKRLMSNRLTLVVGMKNLLDVGNITNNTVGSTHSGNSSSMPIGMGRFVFTTIKYNFEKE